MNQNAQKVNEERGIGKDSMDKVCLMGIHRAQFPANPIRSISQEYYEWKAYKNPVMAGDIFLEMKDGHSVGSAVVMPRKVAILDEIVLAAETADAFTLPECRGQGINTKILGIAIDWATSHGMHLIYGPPNKANYGTHLRLGYQPCEYINWAFLRKSLNPMWLATKLTAKIILGKETHNSAHHLRHLSKRLKMRLQSSELMENSSKHDFIITTIDRFHHEVDPLWGKPRYSFFVYRDKKYLNWRYFDHPDTFIVLAAFKGQTNLGYIVMKLSNNKRTGILCDFVTVDDRLDVFLGLVCEAEKVLKQNGAERVTLRCIADSPYYDVFNELQYYNPGQGSIHPVFVNAKTEMGKRVLEKPGKWHFTFGDTDEV
jgi:GNAT superfamily N-acetyltransferase